eukprot:TRINITY_DN62367_c0_g1_i1.p1 TRINITY_DN62367_c0_g1~~TRINITY_DN62367_c0_g1_i1.p1  ORF type:complete len:334 (+),score=43.38 TRINITY_DN62367_c0_g1_i1:59-1060(+)
MSQFPADDTMPGCIEIWLSWLRCSITLTLPDLQASRAVLEKTYNFISEVQHMDSTSVFATGAESVDDILDILLETSIEESRIHQAAASHAPVVRNAVGPYGACAMPPTIMPRRDGRLPSPRLHGSIRSSRQMFSARQAKPSSSFARFEHALSASHQLGHSTWQRCARVYSGSADLSDLRHQLAELSGSAALELARDASNVAAPPGRSELMIRPPSLGHAEVIPDVPVAPSNSLDQLAELSSAFADHAAVPSAFSSDPVNQQGELLCGLAAPRLKAVQYSELAAPSRKDPACCCHVTHIALPAMPRPSSSFGEGRARGALFTKVRRQEAGKEIP